MPPTTTLEDIKAHQQKIEKDKITPDNLPSCPRCNVESAFFKIHAYRERRFLIIIEMLIKTAYCSLVRFRCPGCGKTFTHCPDFAIPHKHYTRPTITWFSAKYVDSDAMTYQQAAMVDNSPKKRLHGKRIRGKGCCVLSSFCVFVIKYKTRHNFTVQKHEC